MFQYTVSGAGALQYNGNTYELHPGQAFLVEKPGLYTYFLPGNSDHWEFKYIAVNLVNLNIWSDITQRFGRIITIRSDGDLMQFWDKLYAQAVDNRIESFFRSSAYAYEFLMRLMDTLQKQENRQNEHSVTQQCLHMIQNGYKKDLTLEALASACNVSPSYLNRKFREVYDTSPIRYLVRHRIEVAASLLLRESMNVNEVAHEVGFHDTNYFSRVFHQIMGVSPSRYKNTESIRIVEDTSMRLAVGPTYNEDHDHMEDFE